MNIKLKAGLDVVKMIAFASLVSGATLFVLENVPLQTLGYIAGGVFIVYMLYIVYSIRLSQLQYQEKLKQTIDNR